MPITFPLDLPATPAFRSCRLQPRSVVGRSASPFTGQQQVYRHAGQWWEMQLELPAMRRAVAETWIAFLLSLNGMEGTFLIGDPDGKTPRGAWAGTPLVNGASQTGQTLAIDGLTPSTTIKAGDYIQLGSGSAAHLHKVLADATANGSGQASIDLWPRLRESPADNAALVTSSAKGLFRLTSNQMPWEANEASTYGISFSCVEAI